MIDRATFSGAEEKFIFCFLGINLRMSPVFSSLVRLSLALLLFGGSAFAAPGDLDLSFAVGRGPLEIGPGTGAGDGSVDLTFNPARVGAFRLLSNGQLVVGSDNFYRLNSNGTLDNTFSASVTSSDFVVPPDGKIILLLPANNNIDNTATVLRLARMVPSSNLIPLILLTWSSCKATAK